MKMREASPDPFLLEPRQNRKRGDDLSAVEYLQKEDPEIDRKKKKALLESALSKV